MVNQFTKHPRLVTPPAFAVVVVTTVLVEGLAVVTVVEAEVVVELAGTDVVVVAAVVVVAVTLAEVVVELAGADVVFVASVVVVRLAEVVVFETSVVDATVVDATVVVELFSGVVEATEVVVPSV